MYPILSVMHSLISFTISIAASELQALLQNLNPVEGTHAVFTVNFKMHLKLESLSINPDGQCTVSNLTKVFHLKLNYHHYKACCLPQFLCCYH